MQNERNGKEAHEASLVKLYMDLTGASESTGRGVFMYLDGGKRENDDLGMEPDSDSPDTGATAGPSSFQAGTSGGKS